MFYRFTLLLLSVFLLMLGIGLQNTLIGVRAGLEEFSNSEVGVVMAAYFFGFIAGSLTCPGLIERVGHIRAFSVLATLASAAAILHSLYPDPAFWGALRAVTGYCIAGLYMIIESWLNGRSDNASRGSLLAGYFFINLGAVALGQQLLIIDDPKSFELFVHCSVLVSLAIVPVALTRTDAPAPLRSPSLQLGKLYAISPYALVGAALAGLANGAFWGLAPLYGVAEGLSPSAIALAMSAVIMGGAAFQFPLGRLSDFYDRRIVMGAANLSLAIVSLAVGLIGVGQPWLALTLGAIFGGLLLTQYSLCVAHANDYVADGDFVKLASALLLVFGLGAALGPILAAALMDFLAPEALFHFVAACSGASALYAAWRVSQRSAPTSEESSDFQPVLANTVLAPTVEAVEGADNKEEIEIIEPAQSSAA